MGNVNRRPFALKLRAMGFVRDGRERDPMFYQLTRERITAQVQLWRDGGHRASHKVHHPTDPRRTIENTPPTDFLEVAGLPTAVEREFSRRDLAVDDPFAVEGRS